MSASVADPLTLPCGLVLKNRLLKSAMSEVLGTTDNRVTPRLATVYGRWARGGIGTLVTGNVMVDRRALGEPNNVALEDDRDADALTAWAQAGTEAGTQLFMQLNHPGRQSPRGLNPQNVAPSAVPWGPEMETFFSAPRALTEPEIDDICTRFATAARLAKEAGFTGVQVHGAHGYLVSQFLSPLTNKREDAWGGSLENRWRFGAEVYRRIRAAVGPTFAVSIKLNSADFQRGGFTEDEGIEVVKHFGSLGFDLIEISGGTYESPAMSRGGEVKESTKKREAFFLEFAEKARAVTRVPLALTGGFRTRAGIDQALATGAIDVAGLARAVVLDPEFPSKLLAGEGAVSLVKPITSGIARIDRAALLEVLYYSRQIARLADGLEPRPDESPLAVLAQSFLSTGWRTFRTRLRA
jgi:2,4-dienoyl-CoA reductase-like NADH-dependent reductase (Old Yellow Enzyme family)